MKLIPHLILGVKMDFSNVIGHLILGGVFTMYGISILIRRNARVGIGGGRTAGSPLFIAEVTGFNAGILGSIVAFSGFIILLPFLIYILGGSISSDLTFWLPFFGIVLSVFGFVFVFIIQSAISAGESLNTNQDTSNNPDNVD